MTEKDWTPEKEEAFAELEKKTKKIWPFPTKLPPSKPGKPKFNPANHEDAPF